MGENTQARSSKDTKGELVRRINHLKWTKGIDHVILSHKGVFRTEEEGTTPCRTYLKGSVQVNITASGEPRKLETMEWEQ